MNAALAALPLLLRAGSARSAEAQTLEPAVLSGRRLTLADVTPDIAPAAPLSAR